MKTNLLVLFALVCVSFISGCSSFQVAEIEHGIIRNPTVGWNGYSVTIPEGMTLIYPLPDDELEKKDDHFQEWYSKQTDHYRSEYYATFMERFILKEPGKGYRLLFNSETYSLPVGFDAMASVERQHFLKKRINRKKVVINDMDAKSRQIHVNGKHGWQISGKSTPYFRKEAKPMAYEGIFLLGSLKEVYWFEAFGEQEDRKAMQARVMEMAGSLEF